ncbi:hypothetical protein DOY81_005674 [Sarcophaga bullata]|nr:hypothetical protein DOY81_005674 [Sarcophaga bullata]
MQFFVKFFVVVLVIVKFIECENSFCENENDNCSANIMMYSDAEDMDLGSLIRHTINYFKNLNEKYDSKMKTIANDISYVKKRLLDDIDATASDCKSDTEKPLEIEERKDNTSQVPSLYDNMWVVIQRREAGSVSFYRSWDDYKRGFGNPFREFFIGLDRLYYLTSSAPHELIIQLQDFNETITYALYDEFLVGNENEKYQLKKLGVYSGDAGDYMRDHVGMFFSTKDRDNDASDDLHCANRFKGGWWYHNCLTSHLNGPYRTRFAINEVGITWGKYNETQVKTVQMMIRSKKKIK